MNDSGFPDILGILGVMFAVLGIVSPDEQAAPRLSCLALAALCLSISFRAQVRWPNWMRWLLFLTTDSLLAYVAFSVIRNAKK